MRGFQYYRARCDSSKTPWNNTEIWKWGGKGVVGQVYLRFGAIATFAIPLEPARKDDSNGIEHSVIAPKPMELPPNMEMGGKRLGGPRAFEFWYYCKVLYSMEPAR
jgi:hypothetical protein